MEGLGRMTEAFHAQLMLDRCESLYVLLAQWRERVYAECASFAGKLFRELDSIRMLSLAARTISAVGAVCWPTTVDDNKS